MCPCRAAVCVLDICVADQHPVIVAAASALLAWVDLICQTTFDATFEVQIATALRALRQAMEPFVAVGVSLNTPKFHRARDVVNVIKAYGGAKFVSTDAYEMAHKDLKAVMPRCVLHVPCA